MAARNKNILEDIFEVLEVDPDGKKFDKGNRVENHVEMSLKLHHLY